MAIAIGPNTTKPYILAEDRELPKEQQSVFHVSVLTYLRVIELQEVIDDLESGAKTLKETAEVYMKILPSCVCRWDNYKDAEGNDIPHGDFSRFSFTQLQELILAVFQSQKLSEKEAGNSN